VYFNLFNMIQFLFVSFFTRDCSRSSYSSSTNRHDSFYVCHKFITLNNYFLFTYDLFHNTYISFLILLFCS
jgi:hypothetical protein